MRNKEFWGTERSKLHPLAQTQHVRQLFVVVNGKDQQVGTYRNRFLADRQAAAIGGHVEHYSLN